MKEIVALSHERVPLPNEIPYEIAPRHLGQELAALALVFFGALQGPEDRLAAHKQSKQSSQPKQSKRQRFGKNKEGVAHGPAARAPVERIMPRVKMFGWVGPSWFVP